MPLNRLIRTSGGLLLIPFNAGNDAYTFADTTGSVQQRVVDLGPSVGKTINGFWPITTSSGSGTSDMFLSNASIVSSNGTATPIFNGQAVDDHGPLDSCTGANDGLLVQQSSTPTTTFYVADQVGTAQMEFSATGTPLWRGDFAPFGQELDAVPYYFSNGATNGTDNRYRFTGKERDFESGLDYFGARYYGSSMGRFMSPDPSGLLAQNPADPQSWNLYAYARNSPLSNIDPTGLDCVYANDAGNDVESIDHSSNSGECGQNGGSWAPGYVNESWAHFNNTTNMFQVGSINGTGSSATVDYTMFGAGATTQFNGDETACTSGCAGFSYANADWLSGQLVGNSVSGGLGGYIQFLAGREEPLHGGMLNKLVSGPLDPSQDNWAGPGGMGPPAGQGDWAASVHDYNFNTNGITIQNTGHYFGLHVSPETAKALIQSNNQLIRNAGGVQGAKMGLFFGAVNAFQWYASSWK